MAQRLSALDASFLFAEEGAATFHVGGVAVFDPPAGGVDLDAIARHVESRLPLVPRFRQRIRSVPGGMARPVWVDDANFDLSHHLRRSALPRPGGRRQLEEFVARVMSRPLDRARPLWELYLIEGLEDGRFAMLSKTHHALVDGVAAVDLAQVLLDPTEVPATTPDDEWIAAPEPSDVDLMRDAWGELASAPHELVSGLARIAPDPAHLLRSMANVVGGIASTVRAMASPASGGSFTSGTASTSRDFATVALSLRDHRQVKAAHPSTVNDVVLTVVAGALRSWLMSRGEPVSAATTVKVLVPISLRRPSSSSGAATGNAISAFFVELPVGESRPIARLQQVALDMRGVKEGGQSVGAKTMIGGLGYAPATVHSLAARAANALSTRVFDLTVTNVPGPQLPLYADGARLLEAYPVASLAHGQALAIGVTSYDGVMHYGLIADRESMPDLHVLAQCLRDSLAELVDLSA